MSRFRRVEWENPYNPDDIVLSYICPYCDEQGFDESWAEAHSCDIETLFEEQEKANESYY